MTDVKLRKDLTKAIPTDILYELGNALAEGLHFKYTVYGNGDDKPDRSFELRIRDGERCHVNIDK